ncbi:Transcriptional activator protein CopR [Methylacidimicrobium cyclopophantes]|uniref:Transcriptional activator protein CopR n=1 Tax=Methylacidimicrobium cyclopophantes TaxID=1041766 RepID=A0A5E6M5U6_9BACT|nr:response regulator transcription factor [Methylacidimicrobium cyclopophantes]VVM04688.1 Transcriptional activator protein CopR [Methylacidimicrobium cyclopophantes]
MPQLKNPLALRATSPKGETALLKEERNRTPKEEKAWILLAEPDEKLAAAIGGELQGKGLAWSRVSTTEEAFVDLNFGEFAVALLDSEMPGRPVLDVVEMLRRRNISIPILLLSGEADAQARIRAYEKGVDDVVPKPCSPQELSAHIRALLRRRTSSTPWVRAVEDLEIDLSGRRVFRAGQEILLTPREFGILEYLLRNQGRAVSFETLAQEVWHQPERAKTISNVVRVHMASLRKKIDRGRPVKLLHTMRGYGFVLRSESR